MKRIRYSDEQIVRILREADQMPVAKAAKKNGVSEATCIGCAIDTWVSVATGEEGLTCIGGDVLAGADVSSSWLSADCDPAGARRTCDEH